MKQIRKYLVGLLLLNVLGSPLSVLADELTEQESAASVDESELDIEETEELVPPIQEVPPFSPLLPDTEEKATEEKIPGDKQTESEKPTEPKEIVVQPEKEEEATKQVPNITPVRGDESVAEQVESVGTLSWEVLNDVVSAHFNKELSTEEFILSIGEQARKVGQEKDLYASVMIAQAILESNSGKSRLASEPYYNLFGIKGQHNGQSASLPTQEDDGNGNLYWVNAHFRSYDSYKDSLSDYAALMSEGTTWDSNFYQGVFRKQATDFKQATAYLQGRYATDTSYAAKLNGLIQTYNLTEYDRELAETKELGSPIKGEVTITSNFGQRGDERHRGTDFGAETGTPILAIQSGVVLESASHDSWGEYVKIQHKNGVTSLYAHQTERVAKVGETVEKGQLIGFVGSTGYSTGPHLHLELSLNNQLVNALEYLEKQ